MSFNLWLTGFSGSGKSTLAKRVSDHLASIEVAHEIIDPDDIRRRLFPNLGFSDEERVIFRRSLLFLATLLNPHQVSCILPLLSSRRKLRRDARAELPNFLEVYVKCPIEVCQERDPKGLYMRAQTLETPHIVGLDMPYEEPENPELVVETDRQDIDSCTNEIISLIRQRGYLGEYEANG